MPKKNKNENNQIRKKIFELNQLFEFNKIAKRSSNFSDFCEQLYELATKDGLTKLYTYRHFCLQLENEIKRSTRYNHEFALLIFDIDDFKKINDTCGHPIGDKFLHDLADVLIRAMRKIDYAARYGGDEFVAILPETDLNNAKNIAERIREKIANIEIKGRGGDVLGASVSVGIAAFSPQTGNAKNIVELADSALYEAKKRGKNCVVVYED